MRQPAPVTSGPAVSIGAAVARHVAFTLLLGTVLSALAGAGFVVFAGQQAHRSAEQVARQVTSAVLAPLARRDFAQPIGPVRHELDGALSPFLTSGIVYRIKVWSVQDSTARIVYSDKPQLEGASLRLEGPATAAPAAGQVLVEPVPRDSEHRFEAPVADNLREVFVDFRDSADNAARLEIYVPVDESATIRETAAAVLPLHLLGLLGLSLATLPLSLLSARRRASEHAEQRAARLYGLAAAERSRVDLARRLHDGVIPDLAGASLLLEAARAEPPGAAGSARTLLDNAHHLLTAEVHALRRLLDDLVPARPTGEDLASALHGLVDQLRSTQPADRDRTDVAIAVSPEARLDGEAAVVLSRIAGELLRNVFGHADARHVLVRVAASTAEAAELTVSDDGRGFDPHQDRREGHVGLLLVRRVVEDHGGRLDIASAAGRGTTVTVALPARSPRPGPRGHDGFARRSIRRRRHP